MPASERPVDNAKFCAQDMRRIKEGRKGREKKQELEN